MLDGFSEEKYLRPKPEPVNEDIIMREPEVVPPTFVKYTSAAEITYTPENALTTGTSMVEEVKALVEKLELGSKMRKTVYVKDIDKSVFSSFKDASVMLI